MNPSSAFHRALRVFVANALRKLIDTFYDLLSPEKANPAVEGPALNAVELQELWRADIVVHVGGILPVRDVIEARAEGEIKSEQAKSSLGVQVQ